MAAKKENENIETAADGMETTQETTPEATQESTPDPNELVTIQLFEDGDRYKDDVFVAVNGKTFRIQRGKDVKVPRYVKEVLDNSMKQDKAANSYMKKKQEDFEKESSKI